MKPSRLSLAGLAALALAWTTAAPASIVIVAPTAATPGSLTITAPISFTLSVSLPSGSVFNFDLQNLVPTVDGNQTGAQTFPNLAFTINGVPAVYAQGQVSFFYDNFFFTNFGATSPRDGYLFAPSITNAAPAGSIVTLSTGTYSLAATANFNPLTTQTFTGNMFLFGTFGDQISNVVSVPEPSTWVLLCAAGVGLLARARRRALTQSRVG